MRTARGSRLGACADPPSARAPEHFGSAEIAEATRREAQGASSLKAPRPGVSRSPSDACGIERAMTRIRGSEIRQAQRFAREPAESYSARLVDTPKTRAEDSCARINGSLAWRAAEP